jgi:hypothetical protein
MAGFGKEKLPFFCILGAIFGLTVCILHTDFLYQHNHCTCKCFQATDFWDQVPGIDSKIITGHHLIINSHPNYLINMDNGNQSGVTSSALLSTLSAGTMPQFH